MVEKIKLMKNMQDNQNTYLFKYENNVCEQAEYLFDATKFAEERNIPLTHEWLGFSIIDNNQIYYLSEAQYKIVDGVESCEFGFVQKFHPHMVMITKNGNELVKFCKLLNFDDRFDHEAYIWAIYTDQQDNYTWHKLHIVMNQDKERQIVIESRKSIKNTSKLCKSFDWEKELWETYLAEEQENPLAFQFSFMGQPYNRVKEYVQTKYDCELTIDVLLAIARVYRGYAYNLIIFDILTKVTLPEQLDDLIRSPVLNVKIAPLVEKVHKILSEGKTFDLPFKELIPYMDDCDYIGVLQLNLYTEVLLNQIMLAYGVTPQTPYRANTEQILVILLQMSTVLSLSEKFIKKQDYQEFVRMLCDFFKGEVIYKSKPTVVITKLQMILSKCRNILEDLEYDIGLKAGYYVGEITTLRKRQQLLHEKKLELDGLMRDRDHLENSVTSAHSLNQAEIKLANYKAKLKKFEKAYEKGTMKQHEWNEKTPKLIQKINDLEIIIPKGKEHRFEEVKQARIEISKKITIVKAEYDKLSVFSRNPELETFSMKFRNMFQHGVLPS